MASINGISIKGINNFLGHEGEPLCQGNVYLGNKKLGFWSQDSWGGPDQFHLDPKYSKKLIDEAVIKRNSEKAVHGNVGDRSYVIEYDLEQLLGDCVELAEEEKIYQEAVKSGYAGILLATDGFHQATWNLPASYTQLSDEELLNKLDTGINKVKESFWKENEYTQHKIKIYRSMDDFVIGEPIKLEEISVKKNLKQTIQKAKNATELNSPVSQANETEKGR